MEIKTDEIPKSEGNMMAMMLYETISEYFKDPMHTKQFEEWKAEKDKQQIGRVK